MQSVVVRSLKLLDGKVHSSKYGEVTQPEGSTKAWFDLMIMSLVGVR